MPSAALPITFFVNLRKGACRGISFVDSTALDVCDNHRIQQHKVFKEIAQRGRSSTGWFYGFKLHKRRTQKRKDLWSFLTDFCLEKER